MRRRPRVRDLGLALVLSLVFGAGVWALGRCAEVGRLRFWLPGQLAGSYSTRQDARGLWKSFTLGPDGSCKRWKSRNEDGTQLSDPPEEGTWSAVLSGRVVLRWRNETLEVGRFRLTPAPTVGVELEGDVYRRLGPLVCSWPSR